MEVDAIAHVPISTLFLHSDCSELTKKHLFDLRYLLLRGRAFLLMNTPVPLSPERNYADGARYPPYSFSGSANDVSVIWDHLLDNLPHTEVAQVPTSTILLACTRPFERVIPPFVSTA